MATIKRQFATQEELYKTDAFGGTDADIDGTEKFTSDVDLETNGYLGTHVTIEADFVASPTDHLDCNFYASLDGSNYDDTAFFSLRVDKDTDPNQVSVIITDVLHFRIGMKRSGTTDTIDVAVYHQAWNLVTA